MDKVLLSGNDLKVKDIIKIARKGYFVALNEDAKKNIIKAEKYVQKLVAENKTVYGITTGFGKFSDTIISKKDIEELQKNLIMSHSCAMGNALSKDVVIAAMVMRVNALAKGYSGIRLSTVNTLIEMINKGVVPVIKEKGSLGSSGDLAPLSMMVLVMLGMGEAFYKGKIMSGKSAMNRAKIETVTLTSKEGLSLINGTQIMTAISALCIYDAYNLIKTADISSSLTMEALRGIIDAFDGKVQKVRNHNGQINTAKNIKNILKGSSLITNQNVLRVQDAYSLRCIPQVHGACRDAIEYVYGVVEKEINSATDNPLIFINEDEVISAGNFHGEPIALAMDFLGIALCEIANISERRIERLVNHQLNDLPPFLTENGGLNSGFMIVQYAAASMVSENKVYAHPASVDSIPSSANQEDHVSMGTTAARKCGMILDNAQKVVGLELFAASQAISFRNDGILSKATQKVYNKIRETVKIIKKDTVMYPIMEHFDKLVKDNIFVDIVEKEVGKLY